jgi:hypothetical protein
MDTDLAEALKAHRRRLEFRMYAVPLLAMAGIAFASWAYDLNGTQIMIAWLGAIVITATFQIECRLKTMQVRLAWIHDQMSHGDWSHDPNNHDHQISELSGW